MTMPAIFDHQSLRCIGGDTYARPECVAEEIPVALVYNGISHAVMMATPRDLEDFALGFSLTERILHQPDELLESAQRITDAGIEMSLTITNERFSELRARRRNLVGRTGCGLCGVDSLGEALRPIKHVADNGRISSEAIAAAVGALPQRQIINQQVHSLHAAGWADAEGAISEVREDVGRHNALDKLLGSLARRNVNTAEGFALITSRCSYEMVQKAATMGIGVLVAVSAPTALALRVAEASGVTLIAWARGHRHTLFTHPHRIIR